MKRLFTFFLFLSAFSSFAQNTNVGIGTTTPHPSAALDVSSTEKGMLIPCMTSDQRKLIPSPVTGLLVFDNTTSSFWFRNATAWVELVDSTKQPWQKAGADVYLSTGGNVGIGTATPAQKLDVAGTVRANSFKAVPGSGGLSIGLDATGSTILRGGISQAAGGYSYLQSIKAENMSWGDIALNPDGGNVGVGTNAPTEKLDVAGVVKANSFIGNGSTLTNIINTTGNQSIGGVKTFTSTLLANGNVGIGASNPSQRLDVAGNANIRSGVMVDADNTNDGNLTNSLRFGGQGSGTAIASKRTVGGNQWGLDFYTDNGAKMSVTYEGDVLIGTATPSAKLTVGGSVLAQGELKTNSNVVALNGTVKQKTYSYDFANLPPSNGRYIVWTHNLGYAPTIMISIEKTSGFSSAIQAFYETLNNNQTRITCFNASGNYDADVIVRWIVVN